MSSDPALASGGAQRGSGRAHLGREDDDLLSLVVVIAALEHEFAQASRSEMLVRARISWQLHADSLLHESQFKQYYRMSYSAFEALLRMVGPSLTIDQHQSMRRSSGVPPVSPAGMLQCCLSWLAGGSYHHIRVITGTSKAGFNRIVAQVMGAINTCADLNMVFPASPNLMKLASQGFKSVSENGIIEGCIGVIDGWLCPIRVPRATECGRVMSFFSGHYQRYGLNVQACADHVSRFTSFTVNAPGGMNDAVAFRKWYLSKFLKSVAGPYFVIGDNAYVQSRCVMTPFNKVQIADRTDRSNYNFFVSQLRIRIEMAFGLLVNKWRILKRPLNVRVRNCQPVVEACMRLHNFCIDQRLPEIDTNSLRGVRSLLREVGALDEDGVVEYDRTVVDLSDGSQVDLMDESVRSTLVDHIASHNMQRPQRNINRNSEPNHQVTATSD
jgi:hypothetical protein